MMKYALNNGDKQPNFLVMFFTMNKQKPSITQREKIYIKTGEGGREKASWDKNSNLTSLFGRLTLCS